MTDDNAAAPERPRRTVKSFVRRQGRLTPAQEKALETHGAQWGLSVQQGVVDPRQVFGRDARRVLEIGFGNGDTLLELARREPDSDFIGVEVHRPGVGRLLNEVAKAGLGNVRVFSEDAVDVLGRAIAPESLDGVLLFFPDPWHKKKHHKRRIVQPVFAALVASRLKPGGMFHMATDWEPYALHMMEVMSSSAHFTNASGDGQFFPRPETRPVTRFERRGERLGHGVWDLCFTRVRSPDAKAVSAADPH